MSRLIARVASKAGPVLDEVWQEYLQRRVMHLLLRHDRQTFHSQFRTFFAGSSQPVPPLLDFYDRYLRLQVLGEDLLLRIVPDITRQLSLEIEFVRRVEEPPTQGEIDWHPTITRAVNEAPDQPPMRFDTRQRSQNLALPENLLVVAVLLNYREAVRNVLREDSKQEILNEQERLVLIEMEERVEQQLRAAYAHSLEDEARRFEIDALIEQTMPRLKPGANPYRDLIDWWEEFRDLRPGQLRIGRHSALVQKHDEERAASWLYEFWIALEILDLLQEQQLLASETLEISLDHFHYLFTWQERSFRFSYQRTGTSVTDELPGSWQGSGAPRTAYRIERASASPIELAGKIIWREPPVMLAASSAQSNQLALQQLLGGMQLVEASAGILFSSLLADPPTEQAWSDIVQPEQNKYSKQLRGQTSVHLYKIVPDMPLDLLHRRLHAALQQAINALPERPAPACYGILLDRDTVNAARNNVQAGNVLCPKPHIGPGIFDLVDDRLHCLKDPRLCHVYGQPVTPPFVIRVDTLDGLDKKSSDLRARAEEKLREAEDADDEARVEQLRGHIFLDVGRAVERYVQVHGNTASIEERFEDWIFGDFWKKHPRCLSEKTRNYLLSGEYVWEEYKRTRGLNDWAAPAIQYCRALENEIHRRIHDYYPDRNAFYSDVRQKGFSDHMTLGFLEIIYLHKGKSWHSGLHPQEQKKIKSAQHNWPLCEAVCKRSKCNIMGFEQMIQRVGAERIRRNKLAHGDAILRSDAQALRDAIIGRKEKPGILLWLAENLEPKK